MKVITLSKRFLSAHRRAGEPTGFREAYLEGRKIHTVRVNARGYFKDGHMVSVRKWSGKPYGSKQEVIQDGVQIGVEPIRIFCSVGVTGCIARNITVPAARISFNDGLTLLDFCDWFSGGKPVKLFQGSIIHFTDFRYSKVVK